MNIFEGIDENGQPIIREATPRETAQLTAAINGNTFRHQEGSTMNATTTTPADWDRATCTGCGREVTYCATHAEWGDYGPSAPEHYINICHAQPGGHTVA